MNNLNNEEVRVNHLESEERKVEVDIKQGPSGHDCTSSCGNDYDCPACEHGYNSDLEESCDICDAPANK